MLVDDEVAHDDTVGTGGAPVGEGDHIGYELEGWGNQLKVALDGMLLRAGIRRVWEAGALVVSATDEDAVDELIATLDGGDVPELDDDVERIAFEIEGLDVDGRAELDARLVVDGVAHGWTEEGDLLVAAADEELVAAIIEGVLEGVDDEVDGLAAHEALSALFVATDRLVKAPLDQKPGEGFRAAAGALETLPVPFGFSADDWSDLRGEVDRLATLIGGAAEADDEEGADAPDDVPDLHDEVEDEVEDEDDDEVDDDDESPVDRARAAAAALRERLREFV